MGARTKNWTENLVLIQEEVYVLSGRSHESNKLYIKYAKSTAAVIRELGYPSRKLLPKWYKEYLEEQSTGTFKQHYTRKPRYTRDQKQAAIDYYLEHGCSSVRTIMKMGYPHKETFRLWLDEFLPDRHKKRSNCLKYSQEQKKDAIISLCSRTGSAKRVSDEYGISRNSLYIWKNKLLSKDGPVISACEVLLVIYRM